MSATCSHRNLHPGRARAQTVPGVTTHLAVTTCMDCDEGIFLQEQGPETGAKVLAAFMAGGVQPGTEDRALLIVARDIIRRLSAGEHACVHEVQTLLANTDHLEHAHVQMGDCPTPDAPDRRDGGCPACRAPQPAPRPGSPSRVVH